MSRIITFVLSGLVLSAAAPEIQVLNVSPGSKAVEIVFTSPLINAGDQTIANDCKITAPPEETKAGGSLARGFADRISIPLNNPVGVGTKVEVSCDSIEYYEGVVKKTAKNLKASYTVPPAAQLQQLLLEKMEKQTKSAKKTGEDIFASGFVTTASQGAAGGADIFLAPDLKIPNFRPFLQIKKTTQDGADAKNFEAGGIYQIAFISNKKAFQAIRGMGGSPINTILNEFNRHKKSAYARAFAGSTLDLIFKMEGSAGNFEVTNFVGESAYVLRSNTAALFGKRGYFRGFLMPVAFEGGQSNANLTGEAATLLKPDWIARYKTGLGFRLYFHDPKNKLPIQRVELSGEGVLRNLFFSEAMWDEKAKAVNNTGKGVRAFGQVDFKLYVGESDRGRYGIKLSYLRGSLPPVFARVRTFQFGFLWESMKNDD